MAITSLNNLLGDEFQTTAPQLDSQDLNFRIPNLANQEGFQFKEDLEQGERDLKRIDEYKAAKAKWRLDARETYDKHLNDWENYKPDYKDDVRKRMVVRAVLEAEAGIKTTDPLRFEMARARYGEQLEPGAGESDESFFQAVKKRAHKAKSIKDAYESLTKHAGVSTWTNENKGTYTFSDWWSKNSSIPEVADKGIDVWRAEYRKQQDAFQQEYDDVLPEVHQLWDILTSEEAYKSFAVKDLYESMDFEERERALGLLRESAKNINPDALEGFAQNFFLAQEYAAEDISSTLISGLKKTLTIAGGQASTGSGAQDAVTAEKIREEAKDIENKEIFASQFRQILSGSYLPVTYQTPEGSFWGHVERGAIAAPAALATSAIAITPYVGQVSMYSLMEQSAQNDLYQKMKEKAQSEGVEWTEDLHNNALNESGAAAPLIGAGQALLEKVGGKALLGKYPAFDKFLTGFSDRVKNKALRFTGKTLAIGALETGIESAQNIWASTVQDAANVLSQDVPDVNWDEVLAEEWAQSPTTFVAVLPLALVGAAGGLSAERRAAVFADATDADLYSFGATRDDVEAFRAAEGPASRRETFETLLQNRDPDSAEAKAVRRNREKQEKRRRKLQKEAEAMGAVPAVRISPDKDTFEIYDARTQLVYDEVRSPQEASAKIFDLMNLKEKATQARIDSFTAKIKGAQLLAEQKDSTTELVEGEVMTAAKANQEFRDLTERIRRESELAEMGAGGSGKITEAVMGNQIITGVSIPQGYQGAKQAINRLYAGSNLFTLVHERSHEVRRELERIGEMGRDEQVEFFKNLNSKFGDQQTKEVRDETGKVTSKAKAIKFEGFDSDVVDDVALDEAWSHLAEVMLLRTRNGKKTGMRKLLNENLSAMIRDRVPGAQKIGTFISAMRKFFGLNLTRAEAIRRLERQGELDSAQLDEISDIILGNTSQAQYEQKAKQEAKKLDPDNGNPTNAGISDEDNKKRVAAFQVSHFDEFSELEFEYLRDKKEFSDLMKKGFITKDRTIEDFDGQKMILHSPDSAFSGDIRKGGELLVEGKGGIFYPIKYHKDGYFWASTKDAAESMVKRLNKLLKENDGKILMGLTSAPIDKSLSSVTMSNAVLDMIVLKGKDRKFKLTKAEMVDIVIDAAAKGGKKKGDGIGLRLLKKDSLETNLDKIRKRLGATESTFDDRKAFSVALITELVSRVNNEHPLGKTIKNAEALKVQLTDLFSEGIKNEIFKGKTPSKNLKKFPDGFSRSLSVKNVKQALGTMFAEPILKPFQAGKGDKGDPTGYIYAVLELNGPVEGVASDAHESYPMAIKSTSDEKTKLHILSESEHWTNVINDPETGRRVSERPTVPKLDEFGEQEVDKKGKPKTVSRLKKIFPTAGITFSPVKVNTKGKPKEASKPLDLFADSPVRPALSVQDPELIDPLIADLRNRIKSPEAQLMLLSDLSKRLDRIRIDLGDMTTEQEARQKRFRRRGEIQAELTGLREELGALDQAYDFDLEQLTEDHEQRLEQISEDIVEQFAHRIDAAKGKAKKDLEKEAKVRESERKKGEKARFNEAKKTAQEKIKSERLELEAQIAKLETADSNLGKRQESEDAIDAIATLDTILMALPPELRGKVGGFAQISKLRNDKQRMEFIERRLEKMDTVVERYLSDRYDKMVKKLLKRARPKQSEAGKGKRGQAGGTVHEIFEVIEKEVMGMSAEDIDAKLAQIDKKLNSPTPLDIEEETKWRILGDLVPLFGDWKNADSHRKEAAVRNGQLFYDEGYLTRLIDMTRKRELGERRAKRLQVESGKSGSPEQRDKQAQVDKSIKSLPRRTMMALLSFDQVLTYTFGKDSKIAAMFANKERNADAQKLDETTAEFDEFADLFTQIAGSELDGEKLRYKMSQKSIETKTVKRNLSEAEGIQVTMMWDQEDGRRHMKGPRDENGKPIPGKWYYNQDFVDEVEAALSPEAKRVRNYLRKKYDAEYEPLNQIHEALYGVSLPRHKLYSPLTVAPAVTMDSGTIDPTSGMEASAISTTFGSLKTRSSIAIAEPKFTDAFQVFLGHKKQMAHWKAYAPLVDEMRRVFSGRDLANSIEASVGKEGLTVIRKWIDLFATGGVRDASAQLSLNQTINRATGRAAGATLIGRMSVLVIQATQLGAALAKMPATSYLRGMGKLFTGQLNWGATMKSDYIRRRVAGQPPIVRQALDALAASKPSKLKYLVTKMGETISGADALFTAGTFAIIHDYQLRLAKKQGMSDADAEAYAMEQAERLTDDVAQPTRAGARSLYENTTQGSPGFRLLWAFASEPRQKLALAAYNLAKGTPAQKVRALAVTWGVGGAVAALIRAIMADIRSDDDEELFDDRHWNPTRLSLQTLTGPLQGIPILGDSLEGAVFAAAGEYLPEGNLLSSGQAAVKGGINLATLESFEEDGDLMRDIDGLLTGSGLFWDSAAAASSLSHLVKDLFSIAKNVAK